MNLALAILQTLDAASIGASGRPLTLDVIMGGIGGFLAEVPTRHAVKRELGKLETKGYVKAEDDEFRGRMWLITTEGKLRL